MGFTFVKAKNLRSIRTTGRKHFRVLRRLSTTLLCSLLLLAGTGKAKADFIGYYAVSNFTLTNSGGLIPNGSVSSPNPTTVVLTGTNDGSGLPGTTTLTIPSE